MGVMQTPIPRIPIERRYKMMQTLEPIRQRIKNLKAGSVHKVEIGGSVICHVLLSWCECAYCIVSLVSIEGKDTSGTFLSKLLLEHSEAVLAYCSSQLSTEISFFEQEISHVLDDLKIYYVENCHLDKFYEWSSKIIDGKA